MRERLDRLCTRITILAGSVWALPVAFVVVLVWAITGPFLHFSDVWQLTINTGTTIVTFLMIFGVQRTQNRDTAEIKAMLAEIVRDVPEVDEGAARKLAEEAMA